MTLFGWLKRSKKPVNLVQFWDQPEPPEEVKALMEGWRSLSGFAYRCYSLLEANAFIGEHFGKRTVTAFQACGVPAMQADFFRYCALYHMGGFYADADTRPVRSDIVSLVSRAKRGLLVKKQERIANDIMFFREPGDPLLREVIEIATLNIEKRLEQGVWAVTGPGILTGLFHKNETVSLFDGFSMRPIVEIKKYIHYQWEMDYKTDGEDWRDFVGDKASSIYRDNVTNV